MAEQIPDGYEPAAYMNGEPIRDSCGKLILRRILYCRRCGSRIAGVGSRTRRLCGQCDLDFIAWGFSQLGRTLPRLTVQREVSLFVSEMPLAPKKVKARYVIRD